MNRAVEAVVATVADEDPDGGVGRERRLLHADIVVIQILEAGVDGEAALGQFRHMYVRTPISPGLVASMLTRRSGTVCSSSVFISSSACCWAINWRIAARPAAL